MKENKTKFNIAKIGRDNYPFIIAEIGQAHDGSLGMAHSYIDAAYKAGANAIKFQTHIASEESTYDEPFRVKFSFQDKTRYDYWKRMEFTEDEWKGLADHAEEIGLVFLSSPFSLKAIDILSKIGVNIWKIGSGETESSEMLNKMISLNGLIILSSGMSNWDEISKSVNYLKENSADFVLLQCTSMYPTPIESVGLNILEEMKSNFACPVGLSDHSGSIFPSLAALARGVDVLELHITFDKAMFGPDTSSSLNLEEFKLVCDARDNFYKMSINPVDKNKMSKSLEKLRATFRKSIAPKASLKAGDVINKDMLTVKKPATGIPPDELENILGKKLKNNVSKNHVLKWEDIE